MNDEHLLGKKDCFDESRFKLAVDGVNLLGFIVYFKDNNARNSSEDMVILRPQWLTKMMGALFTQSPFVHNGVLKGESIPHVWKGGDKWWHKLLDLLERYDILCPLPNSEEENETDDIMKRSWLVPYLLPKDGQAYNLFNCSSKIQDKGPLYHSGPPPTVHSYRFSGVHQIQKSQSNPMIPNVNLVPQIGSVLSLKKDNSATYYPLPPKYSRFYRLSFIPTGLISRMIVRMMMYGKPLFLWREGITFEYESDNGVKLVTTVQQVGGENHRGLRIMIHQGEDEKDVDEKEDPREIPVVRKIIEDLTHILDIMFEEFYYNVTRDLFVECTHCLKQQSSPAPKWFSSLSTSTLFSLNDLISLLDARKTYVQCKKDALEEHVDVKLMKLLPDRRESQLGLLIPDDDIQIEDPIGEGAFGTVFKGVWMGIQVAVKMLKNNPSMGSRTEEERMLERECWVMGSLNHHPCIVKLFGHVNIGGHSPGLVLEYMGGGSLHRLLHDPLVFIEKTETFFRQMDRSSLIYPVDAGMKFKDLTETKALTRLIDELHTFPKMQTRLAKILDDSRIFWENRKKELYPVYDANIFLEDLKEHTLSQPLPALLKLKFALDVSRGMEYLHHRVKPCIVHRDLKSLNVFLVHNLISIPNFEIMVNEEEAHTMDWWLNPLAKVGDFGMSTENLMGSLHAHDQSVTVQMNRRWLAPEILSQQNYGTASDVYSMGLLLWEIWERQEPFSVDSVPFGLDKIAKDIVDGMRPSISETVPAWWKDLIEECWGENPNSRPSFRQITKRLTRGAGLMYSLPFNLSAAVAAQDRQLNVLFHLKDEPVPQRVRMVQIYADEKIMEVTSAAEVPEEDLFILGLKNGKVLIVDPSPVMFGNVNESEMKMINVSSDATVNYEHSFHCLPMPPPHNSFGLAVQAHLNSVCSLAVFRDKNNRHNNSIQRTSSPSTDSFITKETTTVATATLTEARIWQLSTDHSPSVIQCSGYLEMRLSFLLLYRYWFVLDGSRLAWFSSQLEVQQCGSINFDPKTTLIVVSEVSEISNPPIYGISLQHGSWSARLFANNWQEHQRWLQRFRQVNRNVRRLYSFRPLTQVDRNFLAPIVTIRDGFCAVAVNKECPAISVWKSREWVDVNHPRPMSFGRKSFVGSPRAHEPPIILPKNGEITAILKSPSSDVVVWVALHEVIVVIDVETRSILKEISVNSRVHCLCQVKNGHSWEIWGGCDDGLIYTWNVKKMQITRPRPLITNSRVVNSLVDAQDSVWSGCSDTKNGSIHVWSKYSNNKLKTLEVVHSDTITNMFHLNRWTVSVSRDATIAFWTCDQIEEK
eukprot:TRINITY_DN13065_c0_g1_i1.p1 TRINITY_DN13065_c0_g1~~TRINITY_DN13065_c0_g1_i1.p1  ORF type:complete len:1339 (-),score=265.54 TRINITY_DN13065_c0_g1_i1:19-3969(-)